MKTVTFLSLLLSYLCIASPAYSEERVKKARWYQVNLTFFQQKPDSSLNEAFAFEELELNMSDALKLHTDAQFTIANSGMNAVMALHHENSNGKAFIEQDINGIRSPSFQQRQIKSTVAVQSGETIVLGGLISENDTFNKSGIPFLHDLPYIGSLFGSTLKNNDKKELVILITPRVVSSRQDARLITTEFKRKLSGIYEETIVPVEIKQQ